jgi:hypothetical protein
MRFLRTLILGACPLIVFGQTAPRTEPIDWRFAQPGATLVGGVRIDALLQSPILNAIIEQATAKDPTMTVMVGMMRGALGGVSEVRFSVLDQGAGKDPQVLTLVTGRLDEAAATSLAQGKATVHRLDANTLLLGDAEAVADAVRRLSEPSTALQNRGVERGKTLGDYDLWIAGTLPATPMTAAFGDMLHGLALGLSVRDDLKLELALDTASAETAEELIRTVRKAQKDQPAFAASLLTDVDGSTARFRVSVEKTVVVKAIQDAAASGTLGSQGSLLSTAPKFKQKEPERKTVTIYGLDEGPREFTPSAGH